MKDTSMTSEESLELIARMIRNTQERFERGAGKPFLIWGYTTLFVSIAVWTLLKTTGNMDWNWLWFAIPIIGSLLTFATQQKSPPKTTTFVDQAIMHIWYILGTCSILIALYTSIFNHHIPVLMIIAMLMFAGQAITGGIIKLRYIQIMGIVGIILSFGTLYLDGIGQILGFAALFLTSMIIPGHIMNAQARKADKRNSLVEKHV